MIASRVNVHKGSLIIEFNKKDLRISSEKIFYQNVALGDERYIGIDIAPELIRDTLKVIIKKTIGNKVA